MVSSVRSFLVQLFLSPIDRLSDALGHAEYVMHLFICKPCTVCHPITKFKKNRPSVLLCCHSKHKSDFRNRVSVKHAQCQ